MENTNIDVNKLFNIIVPVYRELILSDKVSIKALFRNMNDGRSVWFIVPADTENVKNRLVNWLTNHLNLKEDTDFHIKEIDKKWFESKHTYSQLLLTSEFYKVWIDLGFVKSFIYQTDCYLFRDEFEYWFNKYYTFIGAPIVATNSDWGYYGNYVGNGGFSMRDNVQLFSLLNRENKLWKEHGDELNNTLLEKHTDEKYIDYEDIFICQLLAKHAYVDLPSAKEAAKFAYDRNPDICAEMYGVKCPMCAHNFMLLSNYWAEFIPELTENEELAKDAKIIVDTWNSLDHPEEHGRQGWTDV